MNPALHNDNTCNDFVERFLNQDMLANPTVIQHKAVLLANIAQPFAINPVPLSLFLVDSYAYEGHKLAARYLKMQALNAIQIYYIC